RRLRDEGRAGGHDGAPEWERIGSVDREGLPCPDRTRELGEVPGGCLRALRLVDLGLGGEGPRRPRGLRTPRLRWLRFVFVHHAPGGLRHPRFGHQIGSHPLARASSASLGSISYNVPSGAFIRTVPTGSVRSTLPPWVGRGAAVMPAMMSAGSSPCAFARRAYRSATGW